MMRHLTPASRALNLLLPLRRQPNHPLRPKVRKATEGVTKVRLILTSFGVISTASWANCLVVSMAIKVASVAMEAITVVASSPT